MCSHFLCQVISKELQRTSCTTTPWPIQRNHYHHGANKYIRSGYTGIHSITVSILDILLLCFPSTHVNVPNFCRPIKYQDKHDRLSKSNTITFRVPQKTVRMFLFVGLLFLRNLSNFARSEPGKQLLLFFSSFWPSLLLSSSTRSLFLQRYSGQAVVTTTACCSSFSVSQDAMLYNANKSAPSENNRFSQVL